MTDAAVHLNPIGRPEDPSPQQREVLTAILEFWSRRAGQVPTIHELGAVLGIKFSRCRQIIDELERRMLIQRQRGDVGSCKRAARVTDYGLMAMGLPPKIEPAGMHPVEMPCRVCGRKVKHVELAKSFSFEVKSYVVHWKSLEHQCARAAEKQRSRAADEHALAAGKKSRAQLRVENGAFAIPSNRIRLGVPARRKF